ncbi:MAG TPA: hypothetical protein VKS21_05280 [Spirochaetota bacterium]|nr:hypothetical protein [Spirochaetota bacterium]
MWLESLFPGLYRARFEKLSDLAMSFCRMQEFYDDAMFHGRILTLTEFIELWKQKRGEGNFTYPEYWSGYGLKGKTVCRWLDKLGWYSRLEPREKKLLTALEHKHGSRDFSGLYLFGVCEEEGERERITVTNHEIAHFLFFANKRYRQKVSNAVRQFPGRTIRRFELTLKRKFYHRKVFYDEMQADIAANGYNGLLNVKSHKVNRKYYYLYRRIMSIFQFYLRELFRKYPNPELARELDLARK